MSLFDYLSVIKITILFLLSLNGSSQSNGFLITSILILNYFYNSVLPSQAVGHDFLTNFIKICTS